MTRRLMASIVVIFGISIVMFGLLHATYPSPAREVLGMRASVAAVDAWNKANGYYDPVAIQYLRYVGDVLRGDLGYSYVNNQTVADLLLQRAPRSAYLAGISLLLSVLIALPVGVYQAARRNSIGDNVVTGLALITYSMPLFLLGLLLIQVFALWLPIFSFEASQSASMLDVMTAWHEMTLPIATLTGLSVAIFSRYMRSSSLDVLAQDYIRVVRAKGLPERLVLARHLMRNAAAPIITLIGLFIPTLLTGDLITEYLFNYPGLGLLFFNSLQRADYPVLLAFSMLGAILVVAGNFLADIGLVVTDPRIQLT
ncbi:ABC transporter permease [Nonomuraea sp. B1E8]|uniref:ABC transporter permease n=1 Tax=unclassified Nonomuraea TaxID=2593643 RepID=UPI00325E5E0C